MPNIRAIDFQTIDQIFGMEGGYVIDFSNRTFADFFLTELHVDIDNPRYAIDGTSKAKRLRFFLKTVDARTAIKTLEALWEYREHDRERRGQADSLANAHGKLLTIFSRLQGSSAKPSGITPEPASNLELISNLKSEFNALAKLLPHERGYKFEKFLKSLFDAYGLGARDPFRIRGEQIDGSFSLDSQIYLVEAKWQASLTGAESLHTFHGKIEQKASWARGVFISYSGFTEDGLHAFGRAKRLICVDGLDLSDMFDMQIPLDAILRSKVRRAAETGAVLFRTRDIKGRI